MSVAFLNYIEVKDLILDPQYQEENVSKMSIGVKYNC